MKNNKKQILAAYHALGLHYGTPVSEIKKQFRSLALKLHPDVNPSIAAQKKFYIVNEAYAYLMQNVPTEKKEEPKVNTKTSAKANTNDEKVWHTHKEAYNTKYATTKESESVKKPKQTRKATFTSYADFQKKQNFKATQSPSWDAFFKQEREKKQAQSKAKVNQEQKVVQKNSLLSLAANMIFSQNFFKKSLQAISKKMNTDSSTKSILQQQLDETIEIFFPIQQLYPGSTLRVNIAKSLPQEKKCIEITLPKDFMLGKTICLKSLGKQFGHWKGDLYLKIQPKTRQDAR